MVVAAVEQQHWFICCPLKVDKGLQMIYIDDMLRQQQEHHNRTSTVRIPKKLLESAIEEANRRGVGKGSVFLRMIILERIRHPEGFDELKQTNRADLRGLPNERVNLRFSEDGKEEIAEAARQVSEENISALIVAILIERYGFPDSQA